MFSDPSQIQEKSNSLVRIFQGATIVDQDIIYTLEGKEIFLPAYKSAIIGVLFETTTEGNLIQPQGVFSYNGAQIQIPLKYVYLGGEIIEFEEGLESTISIIPRIISGNQGYQADNFGTLIYLSPKTMNSLVAQAYLLNNSFNQYDGLELVHSEVSPYLNGANIGEFFYFNGIQGPIKIWKVNVPEEIVAREEFLDLSGEYAGLDNLKFTK